MWISKQSPNDLSFIYNVCVYKAAERTVKSCQSCFQFYVYVYLISMRNLFVKVDDNIIFIYSVLAYSLWQSADAS